MKIVFNYRIGFELPTPFKRFGFYDSVYYVVILSLLYNLFLYSHINLSLLRQVIIILHLMVRPYNSLLLSFYWSSTLWYILYKSLYSSYQERSETQCLETNGLLSLIEKRGIVTYVFIYVS